MTETHLVQFRVPRPVYKRVRVIAAAKETNVAAYIRSLVETAVARHEPKKAKADKA